MRLATLFKIYRNVRSNMDAASVNRGTNFGILVKSDYWAKCYQRYEKVSRLLERRLINALETVDENRYSVWKQKLGII